MKVGYQKYAIAILIVYLLGWSFTLNAKNTVIYIEPDQQILSIKLKAIPTTGFIWSVKSYDKHYLKFIKSTYLKKQQDSQLMGAPLIEEFQFKVIKPLKAASKITFRLARSWEKNEAKESTFIIKLRPKVSNSR